MLITFALLTILGTLWPAYANGPFYLRWPIGIVIIAIVSTLVGTGMEAWRRRLRTLATRTDAPAERLVRREAAMACPAVVTRCSRLSLLRRR